MIAASIPADAAKLLTFDEILQPVEGLIAALDSFLSGDLESFEEETREMASYCLSHKGKRLRPMMVFYSGMRPAMTAVERDKLVRAAAVVELVHQATLVHDDILDDATVRHNIDAPWEKFGASAAVLLGDAMFAHALNLAASFDTVEVCRAVSRATQQVCSGEIAQTFRRGTNGQGFEHYFRVIDLKTAELFRVSAFLGAWIAGYPKAVVEAAEIFGRRLGIAYQIFDDLADFVGDEVRIGKTLGTDLAKGKFTLPLLYYLKTLPDAEADAMRGKLLEGSLNTAELLPQLRVAGAFAQSRERFLAELNAADAALAAVSADFPAAKNLQRLSAFIRQQLGKLNLG